jgi:hypothetical protein
MQAFQFWIGSSTLMFDVMTISGLLMPMLFPHCHIYWGSVCFLDKSSSNSSWAQFGFLILSYTGVDVKFCSKGSLWIGNWKTCVSVVAFFEWFCSSCIRIITDGTQCMCVMTERHEVWELGESSRTIAGPSCGLISPTRSPTWVMSGRSLLLAHLTPRESSLRKCKLPLATYLLWHSCNNKNINRFRKHFYNFSKKAWRVMDPSWCYRLDESALFEVIVAVFVYLYL